MTRNISPVPPRPTAPTRTCSTSTTWPSKLPAHGTRRRAATAMVLALLLGAAWVSTVHAQALKGELEVLEPWIGTWQIEAVWSSSGTPLWAQSEYQPLLDGAFLESRVFVREGEGALYQRYRSILGWDSGQETWLAHSFAHGGAASTTGFELQGQGIGMVYTSSWHDGDVEIKEQLELVTAEEMRWQVWIQTPERPEWSQVMDGTWHKVEAEPIKLPAEAGLDGSLTMLEPFLGGWETGDAGPRGRPTWVREDLEPALDGSFVRTSSWTMHGDSWMQRATAMIGAGPDGLRTMSFSSDGTWLEVPVRVEGGPGQETLISELPPRPGPHGGPGRALRQEMQMASPYTLTWQTLARPAGDDQAAWTQVATGTWFRQGSPGSIAAAPIQPDRFVASGASLRSFTRETIVPAPAAEVFAAWTTAEGWAHVYPPPSEARIDLAIGGRYEWLFDGFIGSNGCQVLSYIPDRMISFTWQAPPTQPENRVLRTWVVVELEPVDAPGAEPGSGRATRVVLTHLGFGEGPAWDTTMAYFQNAWGHVLAAMVRGLGTS